MGSQRQQNKTYGAVLSGLWEDLLPADVESGYHGIGAHSVDIDAIAKAAQSQLGLCFVDGLSAANDSCKLVVRVPQSLTSDGQRTFKAIHLAKAVIDRANQDCDHSSLSHTGDCAVPIEACNLLKRIESGETEFPKDQASSILGAMILIPEQDFRAWENRAGELGVEFDDRLIGATFGVPKIVAHTRRVYDKEIESGGS